MKLTFLGTGTSFGVPQVGCRCNVCVSPDPRDRRTRSSALLETDGGARVLIDTAPELRLQLVAAGINSVDAVLYTHEHADHTHGIDDLRGISLRRGAPLPVYGPSETITHLAERFPYIFDPAIRPAPGTAKPEIVPMEVSADESFRVGGIEIVPLPVTHGDMPVFGYRVGQLAYVTDAKTISASTLERMQGVEVLVLNALFRTEHPTHLSFPEAIEISRSIGARRTFFTHLTHQNFHADLEAELPAGIQPAFDGLVVRMD